MGGTAFTEQVKFTTVENMFTKTFEELENEISFDLVSDKTIQLEFWLKPRMHPSSLPNAKQWCLSNTVQAPTAPSRGFASYILPRVLSPNSSSPSAPQQPQQVLRDDDPKEDAVAWTSEAPNVSSITLRGSASVRSACKGLVVLRRLVVVVRLETNHFASQLDHHRIPSHHRLHHRRCP